MRRFFDYEFDRLSETEVNQSFDWSSGSFSIVGPMDITGLLNLKDEILSKAPLPNPPLFTESPDASFELSSLLAVNGGDGSEGFVVSGIHLSGKSGRSVSDAGDINGDGFDDIIIGAPSFGTNDDINAGAAYIVFGAPNGFTPTLSVASLDGSNGFVVNGETTADSSGWSVSGAGDINGDGFDDILIGARGGDSNSRDSGETYVVFGSDAPFSPILNLSALNGTNGFVINGIDLLDGSGDEVSSAGDFNGDGFDDILIGAPQADPNGDNSGESYVVFGSGSGFSSSLDLSSLNGANGFVIEGIVAGVRNGQSVSSAGDINGDGLDDIIIAAPYSTNAGNGEGGKNYVIFGTAVSFGASIDLSTLNGLNGFVINGIDENDLNGISLSSAGDINGDGFDDILIGASQADPNGTGSGENYVIFGSNASFVPSFDLSALNGVNGFVINGINTYDNSGSSVSSAGDINGDGFDDLIIGAVGADPNGSSSGASYVVFGRSTGFGASLNLSALNGLDGFVINGIDAFDQSGRSVSSAGDINGDGFDDILIGASSADPNGINYAGESYVLYGRENFGRNTETLTPNDDTYTSTNLNEVIYGLAGNDIITGTVGSYVIYGDAGDDVLTGGSGNDWIAGGLGNDVIDGGAGQNRLTYADFVAVNGTIGITLSLSTTLQQDTGEGLDTISNIFTYIGSDFDDAFSISTAVDYEIFAGAGDDFVYDSFIGNDIISGGSGIDTYVYEELGFNFTFDLNTGQAGHGSITSTILQFENVIGSNDAGFSDNISGNISDNVLSGRAGNDSLAGLAGDDTLNGGDGADTLNGGEGADVLNGGAGFDTVDYRDAISGVRFNVDTGGTLGEALGDSFSGIERYYLSEFSDIITGSSANEFFYGGDGNDQINGGGGIDRIHGGEGNDVQRGQDGNDVLYGSAGNDQLNGGAGFDVANYSLAAAGVIVDMLSGGTGGDAAGDTYFGIEAVYGSDFDDSLTGSNAVNELRGGDGDDMLFGLGGNDRFFGGDGADAFDGGSGTDIVNYTLAISGVTLELTSGGIAGEATGDSFTAIEWVFGSNFDDSITGDAANNRLEGRDGNDILNGAGGNDRLQGGDGNDTINGGDGVDTIFGQAGDDILSGGAGNDYFFGGAGADSHDGGAGTDTVSYLASSFGVTVNMLGFGTASTGDAAGDSFTSIERIFGSSHDDNLLGNTDNNTLLGNGGNDYLSGGGGNDSLNGGAGIDSFGYDEVVDGTDVITGFTLNETVFIFGGTVTDFASLQALGSDAGANVIFDFGGGNTLTIVGRNLADLDASNFDFSGMPPAATPLSDPDAFAADIVDVFDMDTLI